MPPKGDAVMPEAAWPFAEEDEKEGYQGWEAGTNDARANFDAGPELGEGTGVYDPWIR